MSWSSGRITPTTGVLKLDLLRGWRATATTPYQEGLPVYWGIETCRSYVGFPHQEVLPIRKDYPTTGVLKLTVDSCLHAYQMKELPLLG